MTAGTRMSNEVQTAIEHGILTVTINRPDARNAINRAVAVGIAQAMSELDENPALRLAILTGSSNTFCSGMDLKAFVRGEVPMVEGRGFAGLCEAPPKKPLIAAVEGYALAGGLEIALACDLIVAADNAKFGIPEAKRGLAAAAGGLVRLPRQIPRRVAMELALTGDFVDARRAYELGLVNRVVAPGTALDAARTLGLTIAANGPLAIMCSKRVIVESQDWPLDHLFTRQATIIDPVFASKDAVEGATAFAEKRSPNWTGR
jgi:enoyl-CoA hydratase